GALALRDIRRSHGRLQGRGLAVAGIVTGSVFSVLCILLLIPDRPRVREAAARIQSQKNLRQMSLALWSYQDVYGRLPPAGMPAPTDPNGKPLLSWRVAILPFIAQDN